MSATVFDHSILFTGHMIDALGRTPARFPARAESAARIAIAHSLSLLLEKQATGQATVGIAGGANGGDLLFHELCAECFIPTLLCLALPMEQFIEASVAPAGPAWVRRFIALINRLEPSAIRIFDDSTVLPKTLSGGADANVWRRSSLWMVYEAVAIAPQRSLLALWDGKPGDGPGGTENLVDIAPAFGIDIAPIIHTQRLFTAE